MHSNLERFIADAKRTATANGVLWSIPLNRDGVADRRAGWNLTLIAKASPPPTIWLNDLGTDKATLKVLNSGATPGPVREYSKRVLSPAWQDLIKSSVIDQLLVRRNTPGTASESVARPLRVLATCSGQNDPAEITADDVLLAMNVARKVQLSGKLSDLICGAVRHILDPNHLTVNGPLFPLLTRDAHVDKRAAAFTRSAAELRDELEARKRADRLPERRAFWELARIVFTERPTSFLDAIRFAMVQILILAGLREGEVALIPADWKQVTEYIDALGIPAGASGGISREVRLRYFGEKQRLKGKDSLVLYPTSITFPLQFESIIEQTLDNVRQLTDPLRKTLKAQVESCRVFSQRDPTSLIPAIELYTMHTGNPFLTTLPGTYRKQIEERYRESWDPSVLDEIHETQLEAARSGKPLDLSFRQFFRRLTGVQPRDSVGNEIDIAKLKRSRRWDFYYRIDEIEKNITKSKTNKISDTVPLKLEHGELQVHELLFLMPKAALSDTKEGGLCDITRYISVGRFDSQMMDKFISTGGTQSVFSKYGASDEDRELTLSPHSLRHLMNTELFRRAVADTIITKRFNRRRVAQSYDYDHRSLLEDLDPITLPAEVEARLSDKSATLVRLLKSGRARGPIVEQFRRMQQQQGELVAIEYLSTEAPGFHPTPYGDCISDFMSDPCKTHVECFNGCKNLVATDVEANRQNLLLLKARLEVAVSAIEKRLAQIEDEKKKKLSGDSIENLVELTSLTNTLDSVESRVARNTGLENQLAHAKTRLDGVNKLLATPAGQLVFPDGKDLYTTGTSRRETVLDTFK
jgi:hypothetical protein